MERERGRESVCEDLIHEKGTSHRGGKGYNGTRARKTTWVESGALCQKSKATRTSRLLHVVTHSATGVGVKSAKDRFRKFRNDFLSFSFWSLVFHLPFSLFLPRVASDSRKCPSARAEKNQQGESIIIEGGFCVVFWVAPFSPSFPSLICATYVPLLRVARRYSCCSV